jgi:hypothetical protein
MINSKNKGNTFERKIANVLSKRFSEITNIPNSFRRNPDSGSMFGGRNKIKVTTHDLDKACFGDIIGPANFRYNVECKHYRQAPSFASLLIDETVRDWDVWIAQATQDCLNSGGQLAIIVKYNNTKEIVILAVLPANVPCILTYKGHFVVPLERFLACPDAQFFRLDRPNETPV